MSYILCLKMKSIVPREEYCQYFDLYLCFVSSRNSRFTLSEGKCRIARAWSSWSSWGTWFHWVISTRSSRVLPGQSGMHLMISLERKAQIHFRIKFEHFSSTFVGFKGDHGPDEASGNGPEGLAGIRGPPGQIGNTLHHRLAHSVL